MRRLSSRHAGATYGKALFDDAHVAEAGQQSAELADAVALEHRRSSCSSGTFITFDSALSHEMRL
jgi:hypothetical protein